MVAFAAYFDDSKNEGVHALAGYLGVVHEWEEGFAPAWRRLLASAPKPLSEFKAADCRHGTGEFRGWTREERSALTVKCVDLIADLELAPNLFGLGAAVLAQSPQDAGATAIPGMKPNIEGFGYLMCFMTVVHNAMTLADKHLESDQLALIFDEQSHTKRKAEIIFNLLLEEYPQFQGRVRPPVFRDSRGCPPLQAADLLAYETYKEVSNRRRSPPIAVSRALERLVAARPHAAHLWDSEVFRELRQRGRLGGEQATFTLKSIYEFGRGVRADAR